MDMKTGELVAVFLVAVVLAGVSYALFRKRDAFAVYDEQGNLVSTEMA
tara:strand:- start:2844 stop:2987 length:144 start_codon:yes stop_codon:yes gene_type:complete